MKSLWTRFIRWWIPVQNRMAVDRIRQGFSFDTALEVGAGWGKTMDALIADGKSVRGIDLYPQRSDIVKADAASIPFDDKAFDLVICLNSLEHIEDSFSAIKEMRRVGDKLYLGWTPWYSPYGGHEFSPWHFFGRTKGYDHELGRNLFKTNTDVVLKQLKDAGWRVDSCKPRYWHWLPFLAKLPWRFKDFFCWNVEIKAR